MPTPEDNRALGWAATALGGGLLLHVDRVPAWVSAAALLLLVWRLAAARARVRLPGAIARVLLAVLVAIAVLVRFHTLNGLAAGTALLILMASLKLLETWRRRDRMVLVGAGLFLLLAACLDRQSLLRAPLYLGEAWLCCAALAVVATDGFPGRAALALAGRTLLYALPLAVLLFVFFPRLAGSFWSLPRGEEALTGLSDTMSPGSIGELTTSYDIAFRARFEGALPPPQQRYWRGPVLHDFDGSTWRRGVGARAAPWEFSGPAWRYHIALEPSRHRWWFALDTPARSPDSAVTLTPDYELLAARPVADQTDYEALSYTSARAAAPLTDWERLENTTLPRERNPRSRALARELRARAGTDSAFVAAALGFLRNGGFVYSLEPEKLGPEQIDDFLFRTRTGFCGHYASAFTVLMRAAGVPARVVTGYLGGEWNPVGGYLVVRQSDAHAWVEVWLAGSGWRRVDPTAVVAPERLTRGLIDLMPEALSMETRLLHGAPWLLGLLQRWDAANGWWNERVVKFDYGMQLNLLERLGIRSADAWALGWAFVAALLGWLALIAWQMRGAAGRRPRPDPLARAYATLCRKLGRAGVARAPHQGPLDYGTAFAAAHPALADRAHALLSHYAQLRYGAQDPATRAREIDAFARAVRRLRIAPAGG